MSRHKSDSSLANLPNIRLKRYVYEGFHSSRSLYIQSRSKSRANGLANYSTSSSALDLFYYMLTRYPAANMNSMFMNIFIRSPACFYECKWSPIEAGKSDLQPATGLVSLMLWSVHYDVKAALWWQELQHLYVPPTPVQKAAFTNHRCKLQLPLWLYLIICNSNL